jgi:hypothetical protein
MQALLTAHPWLVVASLVATPTLTGCCWDTEGSGVIVTETHIISDHARVDVCCGWNVRIEQGDEPTVLVTGDDNIVEEIVVEQDGPVLRVRYADPGESFRPTRPVEVTIRMAAPEFVRASRGASVRVEQLLGGVGGVDFSAGTTGCVDDVSLDRFEVTASDGSRVCAEVSDAGEVVVDSSVGSQVNLDGSTERLRATVSIGGRLEAFGLQSELAAVDVSDGSHAHVRVERSVTGAASGGSVVVVDGAAQIGVSASEGSRVERR